MYRRGGGRSCAVFGCTNSQRKLNIWRRETCELHCPLLHNACPCLEPFSFYNFPRDKDKLRAWLEAVGRKSDYSPSKSSVVCSTHFLAGSPTPEHPIPVLNMERHAVKGTKTEVRDNGHDSNDGGGETSTQKETLSNPNSKRRRAYKVMLEEETIAGDALEGRSQPEKKKIDIEGRYPQGSWEQATVEAIMNLRTFDTATTTSQIAQTIIANLKDENDFLRAENAKLQWELKSMQESHEAELQASKDELQSLKQRFPYAVEHATSPPTTVTETGVVQAVETVGTGTLAQNRDINCTVGLPSAEPSDMGTLVIANPEVQTEIVASTGAISRTQL